MDQVLPRPASIQTDRYTSHAAHKKPYNPDEPEELDVPFSPFIRQTPPSPPPPIPQGAGVVESDIHLVKAVWERGRKDSQIEYPVYDDTSRTEFDPQSLFSYSPSSTVSPASSSFFKPTSLGLHAPRRHPLTTGYEPPQWSNLVVHVVLCALGYPFLLVFVIAARGKTLFWARLLVGVGSGVLGVALGVSLMRLGRRMLEAATWATIIHQSLVADCPGVKLKDLAAQSNDPYSVFPALRLLWNRHSYRGADRSYREFYDSRPWSLVILFFLANIALSGGLSFVFSRTVDISVVAQHQLQTYSEVAVKGDLTDADIQRAADLLPVFENFLLTWTIAPFSSHGGLPPVVTFAWNNDSVFFSEVVLSQLLPNGSGFGTFDSASTTPSIDSGPTTAPSTGGADVGSVFRFPRWGIRIQCATIPDRINIVPVSSTNLTYLYTPRDTLRPLFDGFNMSLPAVLETALDTSFLATGDTLPDGLDLTSIAMAATFSDNGVAYSMKSTPLSLGDDGTGFVTVENILVRLNTTYAPNGTFSTTGSSIPDQNGTTTFIGYDAAVCLELYEPWILEVYNSSAGLPISMRIVDKTAVVTDAPNTTEKMIGDRLMDPSVKRQLNSTGLMNVYIATHQNSVNQILKDNGRDSFYVPSPTLVSFTSGHGPDGYTQLSAQDYAKARALADGGNVLPYFAGSASTLARSYLDSVMTNTVILNIPMAIILAVVLLMGMISAFFTPRLPMGVRRRGFDLYSWISAFHSPELIAERKSGIDKDMELEEIAQRVGELRFRYLGSWLG